MTDTVDDDFPDEYVDIDELEGLDYYTHMGAGWEQFNAGSESEAMQALREVESTYGDDARVVISAHDEYSNLMTSVYTNADSFGESTGISVGYLLHEYMGSDLDSTLRSDASSNLGSIDFYQIDVFHE